jgi:hypothetical protein
MTGILLENDRSKATLIQPFLWKDKGVKVIEKRPDGLKQHVFQTIEQALQYCHTASLEINISHIHGKPSLADPDN